MTEKEFITGWVSKLSGQGIKNFPKDFSDSENTKEIALSGKTLLLGQEFFGSFEILSVDGSVIFRAENYDEAKFIIYANRLLPKLISVPGSHSEVLDANSKYEKYLDSVIREIDDNYKSEFPAGKNLNGAVNDILRILNLVRY